MGFVSLLRRIDQSRLERQWPLRPRHLPESQMSVAAQRGECARGSQGFEVAAIERRTGSQILHACERLLPASLDETIRAARESDLTSLKPNRSAGSPSSLRSSVQSHTLTQTSTGRHLHTVRPRIPDELRRRVETHRLAVEQRRRKRRRLVTFEPGGVVYQQGKAGSMWLSGNPYSPNPYICWYSRCANSSG